MSDRNEQERDEKTEKDENGVEEADKESFPASDAPSSWAGPDEPKRSD